MAENESIDELRRLLEQEKRKTSLLTEKISSYEGPGKAKMYYALNRQLSDLADLINAKSLKNINIDEAADKTLERMKIVWGSIKSLSEILPILAQSAGLTGKEEEDLKVPFIETVAEKRY
jgi:hypothetical protein